VSYTETQCIYNAMCYKLSGPLGEACTEAATFPYRGVIFFNLP